MHSKLSMAEKLGLFHLEASTSKASRVISLSFLGPIFKAHFRPPKSDGNSPSNFDSKLLEA